MDSSYSVFSSRLNFFAFIFVVCFPGNVTRRCRFRFGTDKLHLYNIAIYLSFYITYNSPLQCIVENFLAAVNVFLRRPSGGCVNTTSIVAHMSADRYGVTSNIIQ